MPNWLWLWLYFTVSPINWSTMDHNDAVCKMFSMRAIFVQTKITLEMTQNISTSSISYRMIPRFEMERLSLSYAYALNFAYSSGVPGALSPFFYVVFTDYFAFTLLCLSFNRFNWIHLCKCFLNRMYGEKKNWKWRITNSNLSQTDLYYCYCVQFIE